MGLLKERIRIFFMLFRYYRKKKKSFVCDFKIPVINGIKKTDFLVEKMQMPLQSDNSIYGRYCLIGCDRFEGKTAFGAQFDLEGFVGRKPIRQCSFFEFVKIYGEDVFNGIYE